MAPERRLYLAPDQFVGDRVELTGPTAHRLTDVLRLRVGDGLSVFDGNGHERAARVEGSARRAVTLSLLDAIAPLAEPPVPVTLACAFPRGNRGDWIVEKATELGVSGVLPIAAGRAVLRAGDGRLERWRRIAVEAAEQCGRAVVPEIGGAPPPDARVLVADARGRTTIRAALSGSAPAAVVVSVGPEGGWSADEIDRLSGEGATLVSLGPRTLRVETAAIVAVATAIAATATTGAAG